MKKHKFVILLISLSMFFIAINSYVLAQPKKKQIEAFRSAKTVKIVVEQSYGEAKDVNLPFGEVVQSIVKYIGLKKMTSDVKDYYLTIEIKAKGKALSGYYSPGGLAYTGASFSGSISLKAQGVQAYQLSFKIRKEPQKALHQTIISLRKTPSDAPFSSCFDTLVEGSFIPTIVGIMKEVYGVYWCLNALKDKDDRFLGTIASRVLGETKDPQTVDPLISLLKDKSGAIRGSAIETLGYIGDPRAIEPLIDTLMKEDNLYLRKTYYPRALRGLTGENFGEDHKKWQKWWEESKDKFLKKK